VEDDAAVIRRIIRKRRSVRSGYTGEPIPEDVMRLIIEAGVHAPTGSNSQDVRFRILGPDFAKVRPGMSLKASAFILVLHRPQKNFWRKLAYQDAAAAIQNMALMATAHAVSSCWFSAYQEMNSTRRMNGHAWDEFIGDLDGMEPFGILQVGYSIRPEGDERHRGRPVARGLVENYLL